MKSRLAGSVLVAMVGTGVWLEGFGAGWSGEGSERCSGTRTTVEMVSCLEMEVQSARRRVEDIRRRVASLLEPSELKALERAQEAWAAYVKTNCESAASLYGSGTMAPLVRLGCEVRMTQDRVKEIDLVFNELLEEAAGR